MKKLAKVLCFVLGLGPALEALAAPLTLADSPLFLGGRVDPNVLIDLSIESPMVGAAYNDQNDTAQGGLCTGRAPNENGNAIGTCYFKTKKYLGYFDSQKCYTYASGRFEPAGATNGNYECSSKWSGNFLNWATMTAIDEFRWALTGGHRSSDTTTLTVLERANQTLGKGHSWYPLKKIGSSVGPGNITPSTVTPYSDSIIYIHSYGTSLDVGTSANTSNNRASNLNVRVKVCDTAQGVETNCRAYGSSSKPIGLIQKYADKMRFAVTSYLNDSSQSRDGGVLRAKMKYAGPTTYAPGSSSANANKEWDPSTGIFVANPDSADAAASGVSKSGVINYINQFGANGYKSHDPAGELFYEAVRYYKNLGRTPEYSQASPGVELGANDPKMDGFPVIINWSDPIQYRCQKNFIVGINDANPWLDKKLPGTFFTSSTLSGANGTNYNLIGGDYGQPSNPDPAINVTQLTNTVGALEGINGTSQCVGGGAGTYNASATSKVITGLGEVMGTCPWPPKENSYYIAGLAYYANTQDIRPDLANVVSGTATIPQTISTYMIDTQEYSTTPLTGKMNMLWLAAKYGGFVDQNGNGKPDLAAEWDTDNDGNPDNYIYASQPEKLVSGLSNAFADIDSKTGSSSSVAANAGYISANSYIYQARFRSGEWYGELIAYPLSSTGAIGSPAWNAATQLANPSATSRKIITYNPTSKDGTAFDWASLTPAQQTSVGSSAVLSYLRGDASNEGSAAGNFRSRPTSKLGDIVNSGPQFVGAPVGQYADEFFLRVAYSGTSFATFRSNNLNRTQVIYVGANDGMLHGFNAANGNEVLAFVPNGVYGNLASLASQSYVHKYFVDGSPTVADAEINGAWKTVLVGGLNGGGKSVYALDVTDPSTFSESNASSLVLWEFTDADLGYTYSKPLIVRTNNSNKWAAIFGNGYNNSGTGHAALYILYIEDGLDGTWSPNEFIKLTTKAGSVGTPNGIAGINAIDVDGNGTVDAVYGGDLLGNMWKFDISATNHNSWKVAYGTTASPAPLYTAKDPTGAIQPITTKPELSFNVKDLDTVMVYFGTGKYIEPNDPNSTQTQTFYAIWDNNAPVSSVTTRNSTTLLQQTFSTSTISGVTYRIPSSNSINWTTHKGWYQDLGPGERHVGAPKLLNGVLFYDTFIPTNDVCDFGGTGYLMAVYALNGGLLPAQIFDTNGNGVINGSDAIIGGIQTGGTLAGTTFLPIQGSSSVVGYQSDSGGGLSGPTFKPPFAALTRISWEELLND